MEAASKLEGGLDAYGGGATIACAVIFMAAGTLLLCLRYTSTFIVQRQKLSFEDWILIPAWVLLMAQCANVIVSVTAGGVGHHELWVIKNEPSALKVWAQTLFITEFFYSLVIAIVKTSILLLYIRIFYLQRWFRIVCYVLMATIWAWAASLILVAIFQCNPVAFDWDKTLQGKCIDQVAFYRGICVPNVIHDAIMLVLPLPMIWRLQVSMRKKLGLSVVFAVGTLGLVASAVRMSEFWKLDAFSDNTWVSIQLMSWTLAEPGVIFVCACLPSLWPLINHTFNGKGFLRQTGYASSGLRSTDKQSRAQRPIEDGTSNGASGDFIPLKDVDQDEVSHKTKDLYREGDAGTRSKSPAGILVTKEVTMSKATERFRGR